LVSNRIDNRGDPSDARTVPHCAHVARLALGKTIHGNPHGRFATMPHLLIADRLAGKSAGINGMLTSILYRATPDDVRMIMIDPKRLPGVRRHPAPDDAGGRRSQQVANALRWAVREWKNATRRSPPKACAHRARQPQCHQALAEGRTPQNGETPRTLPFIGRHRRAGGFYDGGEQRGREPIARLAQMARAVGST
jgi:S-DNA-T family DNA segregation ATPase FtsK/SpoIIIE